MLEEPPVFAAVPYGQNYQPPVLTPEQQFMEKMRSAKEAFDRLQDVQEWLRSNVGDNPQSDSHRKLEYLNMHIGQWDGIKKIVASISGHCTQQYMEGLNPDDTYRALTEWMQTLETTYRDLVGFQDWYFGQKYYEVKDFMERNPRASALIAATITAVCGTGFFVIKQKFNWCIACSIMELLGCDVAGCAVAVGGAFPVLGGCVVGLLMVSAGYGLYKLYKGLCPTAAVQLKTDEGKKFGCASFVRTFS